MGVLRLTELERIRGVAAVTDVRVPEYDVSIDPSAIIRIEIGKAIDTGTLVQIFLKNESEPRVVEFAKKQDALDFYAAVWELRDEAQSDIY